MSVWYFTEVNCEVSHKMPAIGGGTGLREQIGACAIDDNGHYSLQYQDSIYGMDKRASQSTTVLASYTTAYTNTV